LDAKIAKAKENLDGYDPSKYNVHMRINTFKEKLETKYDQIFENKDKITHLTSVGDPYVMFNQQEKKRGKTASQRKKRSHQADMMINPYDPLNNKKELKNSIRAKAEKKKAEKLAKQMKKIHISFACFDPQTKKLIVALVDCEIRIYKLKENGKKVKLEEDILSFRSKNIVTYMEINRFVVNNRQILIIGTNVGTIEVYYLEESAPVANKKSNSLASNSYLKRRRVDKLFCSHMKTITVERRYLKHDRMDDKDDNNELQIVKVRYAKDVGLIACALNNTKARGILNFFDSVDFKMTCDYENDIITPNQDKYRINITCMDYSENNGLVALGGIEGNIIIIDCAALKVVNSSHVHSSEITQIYFYDQEHQVISVARNGTILVWDTHEMNVLQSFKNEHGLRSSYFDTKGTLYITSQFIKKFQAKVDPEIELKALQVKALAKDFKNQEDFNEEPVHFTRRRSLLESSSKIQDTKN